MILHKRLSSKAVRRHPDDEKIYQSIIKSCNENYWAIKFMFMNSSIKQGIRDGVNEAANTQTISDNRRVYSEVT